MIALDSSVLLDLLTGDATHGEASEICVGDALAREDVVVCEAVVAEVQALLDTSVSLVEILASIGIRFEPVREATS